MQNENKPPKPKKYFFGENYLALLNNIAIFELFCGIILAIFVFISADNIDTMNSFVNSFRNLYFGIAIVITISSILIYIFIMGVCHILDNSIENRKLLIDISNRLNEQDN